jgi:hypothetical protein
MFELGAVRVDDDIEVWCWLVSKGDYILGPCLESSEKEPIGSARLIRFWVDNGNVLDNGTRSRCKGLHVF